MDGAERNTQWRMEQSGIGAEWIPEIRCSTVFAVDHVHWRRWLCEIPTEGASSGRRISLLRFILMYMALRGPFCLGHTKPMALALPNPINTHFQNFHTSILSFRQTSSNFSPLFFFLLQVVRQSQNQVNHHRRNQQHGQNGRSSPVVKP